MWLEHRVHCGLEVTGFFTFGDVGILFNVAPIFFLLRKRNDKSKRILFYLSIINSFSYNRKRLFLEIRPKNLDIL